MHFLNVFWTLDGAIACSLARATVSDELSSSTGVNGKDSSGESTSSKERKRRKERDREERERDSQKEGGERRSKDKDEDEQDSDAEVVKVFDGNSSMRRKVFRTITVNRNAATKEVVVSIRLSSFTFFVADKKIATFQI